MVMATSTPVRIEPPPPDLETVKQRPPEDDTTAAWAFVWTLFVFKIATLLATFYAAAGSMDAAFVMIAVNWFWIGIPMFAIWGPILYQYRKRRVRRRRDEMMRAEWMLE